MQIINSPPALVRAETERAAIQSGWGPTVRLIIVRVAPPVDHALVRGSDEPVALVTIGPFGLAINARARRCPPTRALAGPTCAVRSDVPDTEDDDPALPSGAGVCF